MMAKMVTIIILYQDTSIRLRLFSPSYGIKTVTLQGIWSQHNRGHPSLNLTQALPIEGVLIALDLPLLFISNGNKHLMIFSLLMQ